MRNTTPGNQNLRLNYLLIQDLTLKIFNSCCGATGACCCGACEGVICHSRFAHLSGSWPHAHSARGIPLPGMYPTKCIHKDLKIHRREELCVINPTWRQYKCLLTVSEWTVEYSCHDILYASENQQTTMALNVGDPPTRIWCWTKEAQPKVCDFLLHLFKFRIRQN